MKCGKGCACHPAGEADLSLLFAAMLLAVPVREREQVLSVLIALSGAPPPDTPDTPGQP